MILIPYQVITEDIMPELPNNLEDTLTCVTGKGAAQCRFHLGRGRLLSQLYSFLIDGFANQNPYGARA